MASHAGRTRSNTEQAPKQLMQEPTRPSLGEGRSRWKGTSESIPSVTAGVVVTACGQRGPNETREAYGDRGRDSDWHLVRARPGRMRWRDAVAAWDRRLCPAWALECNQPFLAPYSMLLLFTNGNAALRLRRTEPELQRFPAAVVLFLERLGGCAPRRSGSPGTPSLWVTRQQAPRSTAPAPRFHATAKKALSSHSPPGRSARGLQSC